MHKIRRQTAIALALVCMLVFPAVGQLSAETPKRGGILTFVVGAAGPPSFDGHREYTFAMLYPIAPFYSVLIRVNPDNPGSSTDFVCDLCTAMPEPTDGGKKYSFKIRKDVRFHDGTPLTAHDVVASFNKLIFPPQGVYSFHKGEFSVVRRVYAPDDHTVVFELKHPSSAFIPALADPFAFVYSKKILDQDMHFYEKNVMGSGPFVFKRFKREQPGAFIEGVRNPDYYHKGKPYLDGFRAIYEKQQAWRVEAIRKGEALIEFRGLPPRARDLLKRALGDKITVQESDWNASLKIVLNHKVKPFDDPRVRRALTLAIDRWGGSGRLARISIMKAVGGIVFPGHPLAATRKELETIAGYWPDIDKSRAEARRLLIEAGYPNGLEFTLHNRAVDQPYKIVGTWLIGQWKKVGFRVKHWVQPTEAFFATIRKRDFEVSIFGHTREVVNPLTGVSNFISEAPDNFGNYQDRVLDELFDAMNRSRDPAEQRRIMRRFEKRVLDEQAHDLMILWWRRIIPHRSIVRGWKISPSHYLNQDLGNVWLAEPGG